MRTLSVLTCSSALLLTCLLGLFISGAGMAAQTAAQAIIADFDEALESAGGGTSEARQRLAVRRVIRNAEQKLEEVGNQPERWSILEFIFRVRQRLVKLDDDSKHRQALIETCRELVQAPVEFAELRLEADLLLSQAEQARKNIGAEERAEALRPFIARYVDTPAGAKALRLTMIMALELGDTRLVNDLREMVTGRFSTDPEMISFLRDHLGGQVFGVPFTGHFKRSDGKTALFPMDGMGHAMMVYFWSKDDLRAVQHLVNLGAASKLDKERVDGRLEFISVNLDELPDAGESIIRSLGLDWQVLHFPGGRDNPIYKSHIRFDPFNLRVAPTSQTAMIMRDSTRKGSKQSTEEPETEKPTVEPSELTPTPGYEQLTESFRRTLIRGWSNVEFAITLSAIMTGDFLIFEPEGDLDPLRPPEFKATAMGTEVQPLTRVASSVPVETLKAIQECIIAPPQRYLSSVPEIRAAYQKMVKLSRQAIADYPDAPDLWIVRNRLIIALMGLWKTDFKLEYFEAAVTEATAAMEAGGYPPGTDVIPRYCLTKQALRNPEATPGEIIDAMVATYGGESAIGPVHAVACLLALDVADKARFQKHRKLIMRDHSEYPVMWAFNGFAFDRYHDYWLFQVPFTAGWSFGRRFKYDMQRWKPEEAGRMLNADLLTMDGDDFRIPEDLEAEYTAILIAQPRPWKGKDREDPRPASPSRMIRGFLKFSTLRPDVDFMVAMLGEEDEEAIREGMRTGVRDKEWESPILKIPDGMNHPIVQRLGLLSDQGAVVMLDKQGKILMVRSGRSFTAIDDALENTVLRQDEEAVYEALDRGDTEAAKELIMALAPPHDPDAVDERGRKIRKQDFSSPHLRARAKVYMALEEWERALDDIEIVIERQLSAAGGMSLRIDALDEAEAMRDEILKHMEEDSIE